MKAAIISSGIFSDWQMLMRIISEHMLKGYVPVTSVSTMTGCDMGGAVKTYANVMNIPIRSHPASASAKKVLFGCGICFAFWDGKDAVVKNIIDACEYYGIACCVYSSDTGSVIETTLF